VIGKRPGETPNAQILHALLDDARDGIFALDENGLILHANAAAAAHLGRHRSFVIGKPFASFVAVNDRRRLRSALATSEVGHAELAVELAATGATGRIALRRLGTEPSIVALVMPVEREPPPATRPPVDVVSALDGFFLRFPNGVVGFSRDGRVAFANRRARHLLGMRTIEVGRALPAGHELQPLVERLLALPAGTQSTSVELADGRVLHAAGTGPRRDEPAVLMLEDVTNQHRRDRVLHEFVRNAAHQLRTPLTGIATALEVLQSGAKEIPEERDRFLAHLETHANRMSRIAQGLLVLARAQSGEVPRLEFIELRPLLEALVAEATTEDRVRIEVDCPPSLAALAEPDLTREALAALVENAVTHTRDGRVRVRAVEQNQRVAIEISDTGPGVLPEHRERIFEPFYRPAVQGDGFGLGLAIAAQAVKAMDGELAIDDAEDGTRFTIRLPSARILR
jgi:two-component system phosphate regulon sensor histidine kinase PhoR